MTREEKDAACAWWNQRVLVESTVDKAGTITMRWAVPWPPPVPKWACKGQQA